VLVAHVTGPCPQCKATNCFGNVSVNGNHVSRGCRSCNHRDTLPLPLIKKKLVYLDQFYFSHLFRSNNSAFQEISKQIKHLNSLQLVATPYSPVHLAESRLTSRFSDLAQHIKVEASGKRLYAPYKVDRAQTFDAFNRYLRGLGTKYTTNLKHVCAEDLHAWEDYFFVDIGEHFPETLESQKQGKEESVKELLEVMGFWRNSTGSFEASMDEEHSGGVKVVFPAFLKYLTALFSGDSKVVASKSINVDTIEKLFLSAPEELELDKKLLYVFEFLMSEHYRSLPKHDLSARIFVALRMMVRAGSYSGKNAPKRLSGVFEDVKHISTYAPYMDAILVDNPMAEVLSRPEVRLEEKFGTRVFSENTIDNFKEWLDSIERSMTDHHLNSALLAYPFLQDEQA
jgi:hypothetical protein